MRKEKNKYVMESENSTDAIMPLRGHLVNKNFPSRLGNEMCPPRKLGVLDVATAPGPGGGRYTLNPLIAYQVAAGNLHVGAALLRMVRVWFCSEWRRWIIRWQFEQTKTTSSTRVAFALANSDRGIVWWHSMYPSPGAP